MTSTGTSLIGGRPGRADALRATLGVVVAYLAALLLAGLLTLLFSSPELAQPRSAGATRAQIATQAVMFMAAALLLAEGLRLSAPPRSRGALPATDQGRRGRRDDMGLAVVAGLLALAAALLVGPLVSAVAPGLSDYRTPVDGLGLGTGTWSDLGTVLVVAGIVPLAEEALFRGVLVGAWRRAGQPILGAALSAVLFGLAHVTVGERSVVVATLLGLILAGAYLAGRSLAAPVLAHAALNGLALIDGGITSELALVVMVGVVLGVTLVAERLSGLLSTKPRVGRLET